MKKSKEKWEKVFFTVVMLLAIFLIAGIVAGALETVAEAGNTGSTGSGSSSGVISCPHTNTTAIFTAISGTQHQTTKVCTKCNEIVSVVTISHNWTRGKVSSQCKDCSFSCNHTDLTVRCVSNGDLTHCVNKVCRNCNYTSVYNEAESCTLQNGVCTVCQGGCKHSSTSTIDGVTMCDGCGNSLEEVWIYFGFGNGQAHQLYFIPGQTWAQILGKDGITIGGWIKVRGMMNGFEDQYVTMYMEADGSRSDDLFYNGKRVVYSDVVVAGKYYPGKNAQYECLKVDGVSYEYCPGETWATLCSQDDFRINGDRFSLATDGSVCLTETGEKILQNGTPVKGTDLVDGNLTYTTTQ